MTRSAFLAAYRAELLKMYPWALNADKLERFMTNVEVTLTSAVKLWNHDGGAVTAAWRSIGGRGVPTLKALRALEVN